MIASFHGLSAYSGESGVCGLLAKGRAVEGLGDAEICTASRPIGPIGLIVTGEIVAGYSDDVWSVVGRRTGQRYIAEPARHTGTAVIGDGVWSRDGREQPLTLDEALDLGSYAAETGRRGYAEFWARNCTAQAVWVRPDAAKFRPRDLKRARVLARALGLPLIVVHRDSRMGAYQLTAESADLS